MEPSGMTREQQQMLTELHSAMLGSRINGHIVNLGLAARVRRLEKLFAGTFGLLVVSLGDRAWQLLA
jgi:hypothetical protein